MFRTVYVKLSIWFRLSKGDKIMTNKYMYIRRAIYEQNPANMINTTRNISDLAKLFKRRYLIMLALLFLSMIFYIIGFINNPNSPVVLITMVLTITTKIKG
jgi:hypothetical protein